MDCLRFHQLVQRYLDADLGAVHARRVAEHASRCPSCDSTLAEYRTLFDALGGMQRQTAPPDLEAAVLRRIDVRAFCPRRRAWLLRLVVRPEDVIPSAVQAGMALCVIAAFLYAGSRAAGVVWSGLQQGLGRAATWIYVSFTGTASAALARFLDESWPMMSHTSRTLARAFFLLGGQRDVLVLLVLASLSLAAATLVWRRARFVQPSTLLHS